MQIMTSKGPVMLDLSFIQEIKKRSGQAIELCYQCQKCSSGCPVAEHADYHPNQVVRMIQYGLKERILNSSFIWLCSGCETCGARCPNGIKIAAVTDALREMAVKERALSGEKNIPLFHNAFLNSVRRDGRVHELSMMAQYKLRSRTLFADLDIGLKMFKKGKFAFLPKRIKRLKEVRQIFKEAAKQ